MKYLKYLFLFIFLFSINNYANCPNGSSETTMTQNNCELSFNLFGLVRVWTGSITTTTTCTNLLTGEETTTVTTIGCGKNGGSVDFFWE